MSARVNGNSVESYLVMKVRVRVLFRVPHIADLLILPDKLSFFFVNLRQVPVTGSDPLAMVHNNGLSIAVEMGVRIAKLQSHSLRKRFISVGVGSAYSFEPRKIEND